MSAKARRLRSLVTPTLLAFLVGACKQSTTSVSSTSEGHGNGTEAGTASSGSGSGPSGGDPSPPGADGGTGASDGGVTASGDAGESSAACVGCSAPERSCLTVTVSRSPLTSQLPWVKGFPTTDGVGDLVVSVVRDGAVIARTAQSADMTSGDEVVVSFECLEPGPANVYFFLDEGTEESESTFDSQDGYDACGGNSAPRVLDVTLTAGQTAEAMATLDRACTDEFD